jgi:trimeric autotransporter adhesin
MSKISELSDGGVIQGGDTLIAVRSGGNVKVTYGGSTTANIDGGTIDGTVIGGSTPAAGTFTSLTASGDVNFDSNTLFVDASANAVGIGVSTPAAPLSFGSITNDARIYLRGNTNEFAIGTNGLQTVYAGYAGHVFQTGSFGGTERFRIAADGSLSTPTLGTSNVRFGVNAGNSIISGGNYNTVVGDQAGTAITTGNQNIAVGFNAVAANTTGIQNTATGGYALASNTTAAGNTAIGFGTLYTNTTGASNTAVGLNALNLSTTASNNTAVGASALYANTTASDNTAVGYQAGYTNTTGTRNTFVGRGTGYTSNGDDNTAVGRNALYNNTTGSGNAVLGVDALTANTTGGLNTAIGYLALNANTTANNNTAVGYQAAYSNTAANVTAFGASALYANTTGTLNTAIGQQSLNQNTTGSSNSASGVNALYANTTGSNNTAVGDSALTANTTANNNTAVGYQAGYASTGANNVFLGFASGNDMTTGNNNSILGRFSGNQGGLDIRTASNNIVLSDGDGNPRAWWDNNAYLHINNTNDRSGTSIHYPTGDVFNLHTGQGAGTVTSLIAGWYNASATVTGTLCLNVTSNGNITNTNGSYGTISDIKLKENIVDATPKLEKLCQVRVVNYNLKQGQTHKQIGVIAQELEQVFPAMVDESPDFDDNGNDLGTTTKTVKMSVFTPMLIKAIQEQQAIIESLTARIETLEGA